MSTFEAWPKIPRWNRNVVITEKIDGTNAAIIIERHTLGSALYEADGLDPVPFRLDVVLDESALDESGLPTHEFHVYAQSRTRLITPGGSNDNQGFAAWVVERAPQLVKLLGEGRHFGEFYGQKIARNYGLDHKRLALFNTSRWDSVSIEKEAKGIPDLEVDVVPVLSIVGRPDDFVIQQHIQRLRFGGSALVPGFMKPEGIVLYHTAARRTFKVLLEGDELPKGVVPRHEREAA